MNFQNLMHRLRSATRDTSPNAVQIILGSCALVISQNVGAVLNDTGITQCGNASSYSVNLCGPNVSGDAGTHPRQDAVTGRDAQATAGQLTKIGAGSKAFDFTKIANNGSSLPSTALLGTAPTDWACTRDNVTNLVWEVKSSAGDFRGSPFTYSWYSSSGATRGVANGGTCFSSGHCDTEKYVADVNTATLCGAANWRLPNLVELQSIVDFGAFNPTIDVNYFPNTAGGTYWWSSNVNANTGADAWAISLITGGSFRLAFGASYNVRLVRTGP